VASRSAWVLSSALTALLLALPAAGALKTYTLSGDQSVLFPTCGTILHPNSVSGTAVVDEQGDGAPVLVELELHHAWAAGVPDLQDFGCGIPGTTLSLDVERTLRPAPSQTGSGSTTTSISWGVLGGWTQTGRLVCTTHCPGGCPQFCEECPLAVGFEGTGPPPPMSGTSFDTGPWTFSEDGFSLAAGPVEFVNLGGGAVTESLVWWGALSVPVPALPLVGLAALAGALLYLGVRAAARRR